MSIKLAPAFHLLKQNNNWISEILLFLFSIMAAQTSLHLMCEQGLNSKPLAFQHEILASQLDGTNKYVFDGMKIKCDLLTVIHNMFACSFLIAPDCCMESWLDLY